MQPRRGWRHDQGNTQPSGVLPYRLARHAGLSLLAACGGEDRQRQGRRRAARRGDHDRARGCAMERQHRGARHGERARVGQRSPPRSARPSARSASTAATWCRAGDVLVTLSGQGRSGWPERGQPPTIAKRRNCSSARQALAERQLIAASQLDMQRAARDAAKGRLDQIRAQARRPGHHGAVRWRARPAPGQPRLAGDAGHGDRHAR